MLGFNGRRSAEWRGLPRRQKDRGQTTDTSGRGFFWEKDKAGAMQGPIELLWGDKLNYCKCDFFRALPPEDASQNMSGRKKPGNFHHPLV
jgi:hypothetical protein